MCGTTGFRVADTRFSIRAPATKTQTPALFSSSWFLFYPNSISIFLSDLRIDLGFNFFSFPSIDRAQFLPFPFLLRDSRVRVRVFFFNFILASFLPRSVYISHQATICSISACSRLSIDCDLSGFGCEFVFLGLGFLGPV